MSTYLTLQENKKSYRILRGSTKQQAMTRSNYYRKLRDKRVLYNKSKSYDKGSSGLYALRILEGSM